MPSDRMFCTWPSADVGLRRVWRLLQSARPWTSSWAHDEAARRGGHQFATRVPSFSHRRTFTSSVMHADNTQIQPPAVGASFPFSVWGGVELSLPRSGLL